MREVAVGTDSGVDHINNHNGSGDDYDDDELVGQEVEITLDSEGVDDPSNINNNNNNDINNMNNINNNNGSVNAYDNIRNNSSNGNHNNNNNNGIYFHASLLEQICRSIVTHMRLTGEHADFAEDSMMNVFGIFVDKPIDDATLSLLAEMVVMLFTKMEILEWDNDDNDDDEEEEEGESVYV